MVDEKNVLCAANYYKQKFYLNPRFENLPEAVKEELKVICVMFVDEVSGIIALYFDEHGNLEISVTAAEKDFYFDEIGAGLKVRQLRIEKQELFEQLEEYYDAACN